MTPKQQTQFNNMLSTLRTIAAKYGTPDEVRRSANRFGLTEDEALEAAYENIQHDAVLAIRGVRPIKPKGTP